MAVVPQPYVYSISSIPGASVTGFTGEMSDHLLGLIRFYIPSGANVVVNSDGFNVSIGFDADLEESDKAILDGLVVRASEYLLVTYNDGTALDAGVDGPTAILQANGLDTKALRVQLKSGDGADSTGYGETITLSPASLIPIDTVVGELNGSGRLTVILQSSNAKGNIAVTVAGEVGSPLYTFFARWA